MVHEKATGAISEPPDHVRPDRRRLGILLCALSALLTLSLGVIIANTFLTDGDSDMIAKDAPALERFQPAAGTEDRN